MQTLNLGFEIKTRNDYALADAIWPNLMAELPFEDVKNHFLVLSFVDTKNGPTHALMTPETVSEHFDRIETDGHTVRVLTFIKK